MTEEGIRRKLSRRVSLGSYATVAADIGVSRQFVHMIVHGQKPVSVKVARSLGYERVVTYQRVT